MPGPGTGGRGGSVVTTRQVAQLSRRDDANVVKVFTSGSEGDQWFYAMELIEGTDLAAVCTQLATSTASDVSEDDWTAAVSTARERKRQQEARPDGPPEPRPEVPAVSAPPRRSGPAHSTRAVDVVRQAAR